MGKGAVEMKFQQNGVIRNEKTFTHTVGVSQEMCDSIAVDTDPSNVACASVSASECVHCV